MLDVYSAVLYCTSQSDEVLSQDLAVNIAANTVKMESSIPAPCLIFAVLQPGQVALDKILTLCSPVKISSLTHVAEIMLNWVVL